MGRWGPNARTAAGTIAAGLAGLVVACCLLVVPLWPVPAGAHARVTASSPADGTSVDAAPESVTLTLAFKPATVEGDPLMVFAPGGRRVDAGPATVGADGTTLTVPLDAAQALPAGDYQVVYRVVSADAHVIVGRLSFSARADRAPSAGAVGPLQRLGSAWTPGSEGEVAAPAGATDVRPAAAARRLAPAGPTDVRPLAAAGAAVVLVLAALAWRLGPGRVRARRRAAVGGAQGRSPTAGARSRTRRARAEAAQPHDPRQHRRPSGRRPAPVAAGSPGARPRPRSVAVPAGGRSPGARGLRLPAER